MMWEFFKRENSFIESCLSLSRMRKCITAAVTAKVIVYKSCSDLHISIGNGFVERSQRVQALLDFRC